jgi:hypothetical protein
MVYGTVVVMATLTIGYAGETHSWTLAIAVFCAAFVLWFAHVCAHGVSESIVKRRRLALRELTSVASHERGILLAAAVPTSVLLLGAGNVMRETAAVWLALASGLVTLASKASAMHASRASGQAESGHVRRFNDDPT